MLRRSDLESIVKRVQSALTPELLIERWRKQSHPLEGHCYVAAEACFHLLGRNDWKPMVASYVNDGVKETHWWLVHKVTGEIIDPTKEQFSGVPPYHLGRGSV